MLNETTNNKAVTISAIMNNTKLSKAVIDALSSPIGSSKRKKAFSILSVFNKGNENKIIDAKGGMPNTDLSIPKALPLQENLNTAMTTPATMEGDYLDIIKQPKTKVLFPSYPEEKEQPIIQDQQVAQKQFYRVGTDIFEARTDRPIGPTEWEREWSGKATDITSTGVSMPDYMRPKQIDEQIPEQIPERIPEQDIAEVAQIPEVSATQYDEWYQNLSEGDKDLFKPFYESAVAGFGPQTASWKLMEDTDRLKKLGVPDWMLPTSGASLTGQISKLAETLRESSGLTMAENNMTKLQEQGLTISDDLTAYIKGKDKYIKNINEMMDSARDYEENIDMSLPGNQRSMKNYNNYLHILKGRQQNRYIDFLNTGINYHNAELTRATNSYNDTYQRFARELSTQTAITKENYERLNNILMDMYSNITGREEREIKRQILNNKLIKAEADAFKAEIEHIQGETGEIDSGWSKLTDNAQAQAEQRYIASSDKSAADASAEFNALSDVEKLKSVSVSTSNQEKIDFYANQIFSGFLGERKTPYFDVPTTKQLEEDKNAQGTPRYDKVPRELRTAVEKKYNEILAEALQGQEAEAGDEKAKSMNPKQWFNYFFGK